MSRLLESDLLFKVERPGQYLGNEWGAFRKSFAESRVRLCIAFPDLYELGMSNFGQRILYQLVNERPEFMCDRIYAPGADMEALLKERQLALFGLESRQALQRFDLVGFSLQYELTYTNVLKMIELAGIPLEASRRKGVFPLVFAGGPAAINPEPMAKFMDFFIIGDGEKALIEVMDAVRQFKAEVPEDSQARGQLLRVLAEIPGIYVPCLYELRPSHEFVQPAFPGVAPRVCRQAVPLGADNQPTAGLVPYLSPVQDRLVLEVRRGCDRGCRFCQPGFTYLPVRERAAADVVALSKKAIASSGYEEFSMLSLCLSDYTCLAESARALNELHAGNHVNMSFPSQRADRMNMAIAEELKVVRKSGMTLAPEAGSERLRRVINKGLSHAQIISAIESAYRSGWTSIKLYYMIGLPGETDEDLNGIIETLKEATALCSKIRRQAEPGAHMKGVVFTCTISNFVPKPFTPFQWVSQVSPAEFARKQAYLKEKVRAANLRNVQLNSTSPEVSLLEAVIGRGDRTTGDLIEQAYRRGAAFDAWDEQFKTRLWREAAEAIGINLEDAACKERPVGSLQPWDVIDSGLAEGYLQREWQKALEEEPTDPCTENPCHACGVCSRLGVAHTLARVNPDVTRINPFVRELASEQKLQHDLTSVANNQPGTQTRIRIEFCKKGDLKFISHLDLQRLLARAARRAGLALAYSEGFSPSPRISLALSLPMFQQGEAELADIELTANTDPEELRHRLNSQLPAEVQISRARQVEKNAPSCTTLVGRASYRARLLDPEGTGETAGFIAGKIVELMGRDQVIAELPLSDKAARRAERLGKTEQTKLKDIRPDIFSLAVLESEPVTVEFCISHGSRAHLKPADLLKLIFREEASWQITRTGLQTDDGREIFQTSV